MEFTKEIITCFRGKCNELYEKYMKVHEKTLSHYLSHIEMEIFRMYYLRCIGIYDYFDDMRYFTANEQSESIQKS